MEPGNVVFESLIEANKKDIEHMTEEYKKICTPEHLADRVLGILESQKGIYGGTKVDLFEHGLQTATRFVCCIHVIKHHRKYVKFGLQVRIQRSRASEASYLWLGSRVCLRVLEAFRFLMLKYAFSYILETPFL